MKEKIRDLIRALRNAAVDKMSCLGCKYDDKCSISGCKLLRTAADTLEEFFAENARMRANQKGAVRAAFILGQMDMRESAAKMLRDSAAGMCGISRATLDTAAEMVEDLEVAK